MWIITQSEKRKKDSWSHLGQNRQARLQGTSNPFKQILFFLHVCSTWVNIWWCAELLGGTETWQTTNCSKKSAGEDKRNTSPSSSVDEFRTKLWMKNFSCFPCHIYSTVNQAEPLCTSLIACHSDILGHANAYKVHYGRSFHLEGIWWWNSFLEKMWGSVQLILWATWVSVENIREIHPLVEEIIQRGPKR